MRRILSALVLIPVVLYPILFGPLYLLIALVLLCTALGLWETFRLVRAIRDRATGFPLLEVIGYPAGILLALGVSAGGFSVTDPALMTLVVLTSVALAAIMTLACALDRPTPPFAKVAAPFFGLLYVAVPLALLAWIWRQTDGTFYLLFTLVVIWSGDTAGYYIGKNFGKHKSSPRISPKKTWEGTVASFVAALVVGAIAAFYFWGGDRPAELITLAGLLNIAGQLGDLAESGLKRRAGVKDSSNLIPGHGGVLDRIDALLFAAPVLWYYWWWTS
jgi:phosphatidate cytidylyltransferase